MAAGPQLGAQPSPSRFPYSGRPQSPGGSPGAQGQVIRARQIIITGPGGGTFVYNGTPKLGNPPVAWMSNGSVDPYGNVLPQSAELGLAGGGTFVAGNTIITPAGTYIYDPTIALGNLLVSVTDGPGTSPTGDTIPLGGVVSYGSGGAVSALLQGRTVYNSADSTYITLSGTNFTARSITASWLFDLPVQDINGLEPGTAATNASWHTVPNASLLNGWTNNAAFGTMRVQRVSSPPRNIQVQFALAANAATNAIFFQLPTGFIPSTPFGDAVGTNAGNNVANAVADLRWDALGNLSINNATLPVAATYFWNGLIPLD